MKAKITHKSNITENGDFELYFNVVSDDEATTHYVDVKILCTADDDIQARIKTRVQDIIDGEKVKDDIPEVIDLGENGDLN